MKPAPRSLPACIAIDLTATALVVAGLVLGPLFGAPLVRLACRVAGR